MLAADFGWNMRPGGRPRAGSDGYTQDGTAAIACDFCDTPLVVAAKLYV